MTRMPRLILLVVAACSCLHPASVSAIGATSLIDGRFDANSRRARVELAGEMLVEVNRLAEVVSPPRPYDIAWVAEQHAALSSLDAGNGFSTRVDLHSSTSSFTTSCVS